MPVALLPPLTSGGGRMDGCVPLTEGPRYVRTSGMSRWHRPRSGYTFPNGRTAFSLWCGQGASRGAEGEGLLAVETPAAAEKVCATCEGRALGAGQEEAPPGLPPLRFDPRWLTPPATCPGSGDDGLYVPVQEGNWRVGRCLACGLIVALRAHGGPYNGGYGPTRHAIGPDLVEPCPWHAWNRLVRVDDRAACACGWRQP